MTQARLVDSLDARWIKPPSCYRVSFWTERVPARDGLAPFYKCETWDLEDADAAEAIAWAEERRDGRTVQVDAVVDLGEIGRWARAPSTA
jgi:hypothetical protein